MTQSDMTVRLFDYDKDYEDIKSWWKEQEFPVIPKDYLSTTGFISEDKENKYAVTWVFTTNSPIYIMEWTVGNPNVDYKKRKEGLHQIIEASSVFAKECGAKFLLTMTNNNRFYNKLTEFNFDEQDRNVIHMMRSL